jgi:Tfp pilus assembly protein PilZ
MVNGSLGHSARPWSRAALGLQSREVSDEPNDERRRAERVPINVEFSSDDSTDSTWVSDLSIGGVFVHTNELLPIGMIVELRFTVLLDDPLVIEAVGKVVRHSRRPIGIGVQFSTLAPQMRERVEQVLARQRPLDSGEPLRLPDPGHASVPHPSPASPAAPEPGQASDDDRTAAWARPAPVENLRVTAADDDVTKSFPRIAGSEAPAPIFRPPPLPAKRP